MCPRERFAPERARTSTSSRRATSSRSIPMLASAAASSSSSPSTYRARRLSSSACSRSEVAPWSTIRRTARLSSSQSRAAKRCSGRTWLARDSFAITCARSTSSRAGLVNLSNISGVPSVLAVLLVHGLPADLERVPDLGPRPALRPGAPYLRALELLEQPTQRAYGAQPDPWVRGTGSRGEVRLGGHGVNVG